MLEHCANAKERWGGVSKILENWFSQRQDLIVEFCTISGVHALNSDKPSDPQQSIYHFCEIMVDYVSAGHFEIYDHLIQEAEAFGDSSALEIAKSLYPKISATTEAVLAFNDNITDMLDPGNNELSLARELSRIGEILVSRFELEDTLVAHLHDSHQDLVAESQG